MQNTTKQDTNPNSTTEKGKSGSEGGGEGYVKETVTFMITDELEISPASTITSINLLNKLSVKDVADLEERTARVGPTEALDLLGAALVSTTALNDVFGSHARSNPRPRAKPAGQRACYFPDDADEVLWLKQLWEHWIMYLT